MPMLGSLRFAYQRALFPLLGLADAEDAHTAALRLLEAAGRLPGGMKAARLLERDAERRLEVQVFGLRFPNPIGLAAGFDKNAVAVGPLLNLGFGFVEVGTVTPQPQPGNPRPRLHRIERHKALINSLGFPNDGMATVADRLRALHPSTGSRPGESPPETGRTEAVEFTGVVGVNLGKGKDTPLETAGEDYLSVLDILYDLASYIVINVSSPNTPGLRQLQGREHLTGLARAVIDRVRVLAAQAGMPARPVLLKVAPDLTWPEVDDVLTVAGDTGVSGVIATNTTISRSGLSPQDAALPGGLSGHPLRQRSTDVVRYISQQTSGRLPVIGVGGVFEAGDVWEKLEAGASLVQAYTGFVYQGPTFAFDVQEGLLDLLDLNGCRSLSEAFPHLGA